MVTIERVESIVLQRLEDMVLARQAARRLASELGFSLVEQTKMVTAVSELARNTLIHGEGGSATLEVVDQGGRRGLRITFQDEGPGISDIERAMTDGYTSRGGLGLGLGGARRLVNDFELSSQPGEGTRVVITRWK